ncbi:MAG: hypothetical protein ABEJ56_02695 [Candidatus Nanohaloarchaea archaeon]
MVEREKYEGEKAFYCECCGLHYRERQVAEECESYCERENRCQHSVTRKSIERGG